MSSWYLLQPFRGHWSERVYFTESVTFHSSEFVVISSTLDSMYGAAWRTHTENWILPTHRIPCSLMEKPCPLIRKCYQGNREELQCGRGSRESMLSSVSWGCQKTKYRCVLNPFFSANKDEAVQKCYTNRATSYKAVIVKAYGMFYYCSSLWIASLHGICPFDTRILSRLANQRKNCAVLLVIYDCFRLCLKNDLIWFRLCLCFHLKMTRTGAHYKFLLVWTLWNVGYVVACISVDTLCGFSGRCCRKFTEIKDIYLFAAASYAHHGRYRRSGFVTSARLPP